MTVEPVDSLLYAARKMNREALEQIFDLYAPVLYSRVIRSCEDPIVADHIVGDVFTKLLSQLARGKGPRTNLGSYLFEMADHLVTDKTRLKQ